MTALTYADGSDGQPYSLTTEDDTADKASRRWRTLWRVHFYAGIISMPFILLMAVTGLIILYAQPIQDLTQSNLRTVKDAGDWISFDQQEQAVEKAYPERSVTAMTLPSDGTHSTAFGLDNGHTAFVNPYTGVVLGQTDVMSGAGPGGGITGLARRLHGQLNNKQRMISLPTVSAVWDDGPVMRDYVIGDLLLEIMGAWVIVLAASGMYLWWPRRTRNHGDERNGRRLFGIRLGKKGRAKWRDLHSVPGVLLSALVIVTIVSGFAWSTYWGTNFSILADKATPNHFIDPPASSVGTRGELDRFGNDIPWNTGSIPIPASYATKADGNLPAPVALDSVVKIAGTEGMKPGYSVYFPDNSKKDDVGNPIYGSFTVSNSWPRKTGEARDLILDQFSGKTLANVNAYGYGTVSYAMDSVVSWHMGTQWGLATRIFMTALCVLSIWAVISALVMYTKRRRPGTTGLPRRPRNVHLGRGMWVIIGGLAIVFPVWGATAIVILLVDRFVIRTIPRLRTAFGQR